MKYGIINTLHFAEEGGLTNGRACEDRRRCCSRFGARRGIQSRGRHSHLLSLELADAHDLWAQDHYVLAGSGTQLPDSNPLQELFGLVFVEVATVSAPLEKSSVLISAGLFRFYPLIFYQKSGITMKVVRAPAPDESTWGYPDPPFPKASDRAAQSS
jgi:hypothetical protein